MIDNKRKMPNILAYPLSEAKNILQQQGFHVEVVIYGDSPKPGRDVLRAARQKLNHKKNVQCVEIVAVHALDEVIDKV